MSDLKAGQCDGGCWERKHSDDCKDRTRIHAEGYRKGVEAAAAAVIEWDGDHDLADRLKGELLHLPCNAKDWDAGGDQLTCQQPRPCAEHPREPDGTLRSWTASPEPAVAECDVEDCQTHRGRR